ncbi:hypothetical protein CUS45_06030 [Enterococcus faecium]|nr:hypothetical protein [Enterococcus faecium]PQH05385.1 hypothetical protein CUS45_06030 [Enterococcus faecium]
MSKKKGARQRFKKRKSYLRWLGIFMILGFLILASPIYTHKKVDIPDEVSTNAFLNTKELTMVSKEKGANQQLVFEFAIDDEDQSLLKELANLNYRVEVKTAKGDYQAIKAKVIKVSDDYFAVKLSHVPEEYIAMRLNVVETAEQKNIVPVGSLWIDKKDGKVLEEDTGRTLHLKDAAFIEDPQHNQVILKGKSYGKEIQTALPSEEFALGNPFRFSLETVSEVAKRKNEIYYEQQLSQKERV